MALMQQGYAPAYQSNPNKNMQLLQLLLLLQQMQGKQKGQDGAGGGANPAGAAGGLGGTAVLGKKIYDLIKGGQAASGVASGASGVAAATPASQIAWNAAATQAGGGLAGAAGAGGASGGVATPNILSVSRTPASTGGIYSGASTGNAAGVLPYAGAAAGLYGLYDIGTRWGAGDRSVKGAGMGAAQGAASGAAVGSVVPGVGTAIGAGLGALYGLAGSMIKAGKHKDQIQRDSVRKQLKKNQVIDDDYMLSNADGSKFDIGKDGSIKNYNVDFSQDGIDEMVSMANPLAEIIGGGNSKIKTDFAGYFTNAAKSSGDYKSNLRGYYEKSGINPQNAMEALKKRKDIDAQTLRIYEKAINDVFAGSPQGNSIPRLPSGQQQQLQLPTRRPGESTADFGNRIDPGFQISREDAERLMSGQDIDPGRIVGQGPPVTPGGVMQFMIPSENRRSSTKSPGIGKDGKRINYSSGRR